MWGGGLLQSMMVSHPSSKLLATFLAVSSLLATVNSGKINFVFHHSSWSLFEIISVVGVCYNAVSQFHVICCVILSLSAALNSSQPLFPQKIEN